MENNTHNNDNLGTKQPSQEDGKMAANNNEEDAHRREQVDNPNDFNSETVTQGDEEEEEAETRSNLDQPNRSSSRTPFTNLSQIDADLALARTLQEQERAYMMLRMNHDGSDYGSWEGGSYLHDEEDEFDDPNDDTDRDEDEDDEYDGTDLDDEEDAFDVNADNSIEENDSATAEVDPGVYSSDEAYARALQEAEEREMAARLLALAGINDQLATAGGEGVEDHRHNSQVSNCSTKCKWNQIFLSHMVCTCQVVLAFFFFFLAGGVGGSSFL
ncbi:E3 ubiquitin ligase BIG BROTHER-related isoform X1 [Carica papaya]|uniref:E3 ubiquitin ligase BIG BROTHER-related isoform X1 n=1 Tax=Carica papaya TaxID=3649 RepID=UPI000B8CB1EA|nr:E3 ubiquitin ligase BIG BROTHER-related isoform X1 [Carica papaya]